MSTNQTSVPKVIVESVVPLTKEELKSVEALVAKNNQSVVVINEINTLLIGGLRVTAFGKTIDLSLQYKLNQLRDQLVA